MSGRAFALQVGTVIAITSLSMPLAMADADDICIYFGHSGINPGFDQLIALYESAFPWADVVVTEDLGDIGSSRLVIFSLPGYENPGDHFTFEDLLLLAINWDVDHRWVFLGDACPPYDPAVPNGLLSSNAFNLQFDCISHGSGCVNMTSQVNSAHPIATAITSLQYGDMTGVDYSGPADWICRSGDGQHTLIAAGPIGGIPSGTNCGDAVLLGDSSMLSDECDALDHPGNRQLALNLYENCMGAVPVSGSTWGEVKGVFR